MFWLFVRIAERLWRRGTREVVAGRGDGRALHKTHGVCTRVLRWGVEEVGNWGGVKAVEGGFSNSPEMHRRDLENLLAGYRPRSKWVSANIHFSNVNYGYYCSFNYLYVLLRVSRRALCWPIESLGMCWGRRGWKSCGNMGRWMAELERNSRE